VHHPPTAFSRQQPEGFSVLAILACLLAAAPAYADLTCEEAAAAAEQTEHLPPGLLLAIGRVETGRWDPAHGQIVPWPWSIDAAGNGRQFAGKDDSVKAAQALLASGQRNVDVGCFQISLLHHPAAFSDLSQALDPLPTHPTPPGFSVACMRGWGDGKMPLPPITPLIPRLACRTSSRFTRVGARRPRPLSPAFMSGHPVRRARHPG